MRAVLLLIFSLFSVHAIACEIAPSAIQDLHIKGVYVDKRGSIMDSQRQNENKIRRKDVNQYVELLTKYADAYQQSGDKEQKKCAIEAIDQWAQNKALLGKDVSRQGALVRMWFAGSIGVSLLKLEVQESELSNEGKAWLEALASAVHDLVQTREKAGISGRNNLYFWSGFSLGSLGQLLKNSQYIDKSREIYSFALSSINTDGTLKEEVRRGQRATLYHAFAAQAIFGLYLLHSSEEGDQASDDRVKIDSLIALLESAHKDPSLLGDRAKAKQMPITIPAWVPLYEDLNEGKTDNLTLTNRKLCPSIPRLGGNVCGLAAIEERSALQQ